MTHLSESELHAQLDAERARPGAADSAGRQRVAAHLASCETCRAALEGLRAEERALASVLEHDPGEAYFESFSARVQDRLRGASLCGAQSRPERIGGSWHWLRSPRALAWVGTAAAVVVGAGIVMMTRREVELPNLHQERWTERVVREPAAKSPPAAQEESRAADEKSAVQEPLAAQTPGAARNPSPVSSPPGTGQGGAPPAAAPFAGAPAAAGTGRDQQAAARARADKAAPATPGYAYEVKRNEMGEDVPVAPPRRMPGTTAAEAPAPPGPGPVYAKRERQAQPMGSVSTLRGGAPIEGATPAVNDQLAAREAGAAVRHCGTVRDAKGHAVAGAQVIVAETGASVSSGSDGSFCIDIPPAGRSLIAMAVGFESTVSAIPAAQEETLALTLRAVPVVGEGLALGGAGRAQTAPPGASAPEFAASPSNSGTGDSSEHATTARKLQSLEAVAAPSGQKTASLDVFSGLSDSARAMTQHAARLESQAAGAKSANGYEAAAVEWERALRVAPEGAAATELRFRVADARNRAWQLDPTHERAIAALASTSSYLLRAPAGPQRDQATHWLDSLRWGTTKATYR
jgi:hypothetical protein